MPTVEKHAPGFFCWIELSTTDAAAAKAFYGGLFGFCATLVLFALSTAYWLSAAALAGSGFCMIVFFATSNTAVQTRVPDELRGRVMGIYSLAFIGLTPFGSLLAGALTRATSARFTVTLGATICIVSGVVVLAIMERYRAEAARRDRRTAR